MIRYGTWHGGNGYSQSHDWRDNLECWPDMASVKYSLQRRFNMGRDEMAFVTIEDDESLTRRVERYDTPGVDESSYIDLFDIKSGEPYLRLTLGPRGGVRSEKF